jgi:hypothetical protein
VIQNLTVKRGFEVHIRYELEPSEVKAMKELKEKGYLEYRGFNFEPSNTDIPLSDLSDLIAKGFIEHNDDAWHTEYNLSELGNSIMKEMVR